MSINSDVLTELRPPAKNRKRLAIALAGVALGVAGLTTVAVVANRGAATHHMTGIMVLFSMEGDVTGSIASCSGTGGYDDLTAGAAVTVRDSEDHIMGASTLENASATELAQIMIDGNDASIKSASEGADLLRSIEGNACALKWEADVKPADFYAVTISHRGTLSFSAADMDKAHWVVSTHVGDNL